MSLELATAFVRVKVDKAQLNSEIEAARNSIIKGLSGIKVKIQIDAAQARAAGQRAGKAAREGFASGFGFGGRGGGSGPIKGAGASMQPFYGGGSVTQRLLTGAVGGQLARVGPRGMMRGAIQVAPGQYLLPGPVSGGMIPSSSNRLARFIPSSGGGGSGGRGGRGGYGPMPPFPGGGGGGLFGGRHGLSGMSGGAGFAAGLGFAVSPRLASLAVFGGAPAVAGGAIGAGLVGATKAYAQFENAFGRVSIIQREAGATEESIKRLEAQARYLGKTTMFSANEAAQAMVVLTQKGFDAEQVYKAMPNILNLAAAGQIDIADSAKIVGSAMKQFNMDATQTTRIVDIIAKASLTSATDVSQLGTALSYVGQIAHMSDKDLEETTAALMVLSDAGLEASRAGTGLTQVLAKLSDPKKAEAFREIGVQIGDASGKMKPLAQIVDETNKAMQGMTALQKSNFAFKVFGQRGGPAFGALLNAGGASIQDNASKLSGSAGTAARVSSEMIDKLLQQFKNLADVLAEVGLKMGEVFGPALVESVKAVADGVDLVGNGFVVIRNVIKSLGLDIIFKNLFVIAYPTISVLVPLLRILNGILESFATTADATENSWRRFLQTLSNTNPMMNMVRALGDIAAAMSDATSAATVMELASLNLARILSKLKFQKGALGIGPGFTWGLTPEEEKTFNEMEKEILDRYTGKLGTKGVGGGKSPVAAMGDAIASSGTQAQTKMLGIESAWSRIQEGLGGKSTQERIAEATERTADNTDPKKGGAAAGGAAGAGGAFVGQQMNYRQRNAARVAAKQAAEKEKREAIRAGAAGNRARVEAAIASRKAMEEKGKALLEQNHPGLLNNQERYDTFSKTPIPAPTAGDLTATKEPSYATWLIWRKMRDKKPRTPGDAAKEIKAAQEEAAKKAGMRSNFGAAAKGILGGLRGRFPGLDAEIRSYQLNDKDLRDRIEKDKNTLFPPEGKYHEPVQPLPIYKMKDALEEARKSISSMFGGGSEGPKSLDEISRNTKASADLAKQMLESLKNPPPARYA